MLPAKDRPENDSAIDGLSDDDIPAVQKYFYRLRDSSEDHHFQYSDEGITCPFCSKIIKNVLMHFQRSQTCGEKIDMGHFEVMHQVISAVNRKTKMRINKQRQRDLKRETNEESFREERKLEKQRERNLKRETNEESFRKEMKLEKQEQRRKKVENTDKQTRLRNFNRAVLFGPIFICSCCHRKLFENGVTKIKDHLKESCDKKKEGLYRTIIPENQKHYVHIVLNGSDNLSGYYICHTCKSSMLKGKMPAMAVQNGLQLTPIPEGCQLTELENNLIAQVINFQYIFRLPKSRWGATKKQMISVPVSPETVMETVSQLPRLPKDAGLIQVNLKRKMEYDRSHKKELIDPAKIERVMNVLKTSGHPYYQYSDDFNIDTYKKQCKEEDEAGYQLLFDTEDSSRSDKKNDKEGPDHEDLDSDDDDISDTNDNLMIIDFFKADGTGYRVRYDSNDSGSDGDDIIEMISEIPEGASKEDITAEVLILLSKIQLEDIIDISK